MGGSLAVILANVWMKSFEASLQKPELNEYISRSGQNGKCKDCNVRVTFRGRGVEAVEACWKRSHFIFFSLFSYEHVLAITQIFHYSPDAELKNSQPRFSQLAAFRFIE